jgi:penicillin-binding protein 1A
MHPLRTGDFKIRPNGIISITAPDGTIIYENLYIPIDDRIIDHQSSVLMSAMLQKAINEGTGASMKGVYRVASAWAGKTGTSQDYADAWFGAFNPRVVMITRVGAATPAIHFNHGSNGSGSALALPLVALTVRKAELDKETREAFIAGFPALPSDLRGELDCPDFREENMLEKIQDFFEHKPKMEEKPKSLADPAKPEIKKKRKSIFDLFRKKKKGEGA